MRLGAFVMGAGQHFAGWRHPEAEASSTEQLAYYKRLAQTAERGKFDLLFLADVLAVGASDVAYNAHNLRPDPLMLLSALSAVTERIGLAATVSTTYNDPFHVARKFATLDHLSGGRAAWNVVTSNNGDEAFNFSKTEHLQHGLRYERCRDFVEVVKGLWDSWEDGAVLADAATGIYADSAKVHELRHDTKHYQVRGPLNVSRPPQGHPVIIQAGSSEAGKRLAAETAEVIFTAWQTLQQAQAFYQEVKGLVAEYGRSPDELAIMPGVFPIIGRTEQEAEEKAEQLKKLIQPEAGVALLSFLISFDLSPYPVDGPLPELPDLAEVNGTKSRFQLLKELAERESLTIRGLYERVAGGRGHRQIMGTPAQIADQLEEWYREGGADGFNIMPPYLPGGLEEFVDLVIPELQQRGLVRMQYEGATLRHHLGLKRPSNRFAR
ncbi:LLM class flavin-dependent oxidoreductase [Paenibacillus sp. GCM10023252]|uniref:LLM class flavin-dependent oxidoreductase n=1 Tax=Paenibacillus sp. GCM10023252 TaxID=3252649 RepID=UPI003621B46F